MRQMKKTVLTMILALCMMFLLTACQSGGEKDSSADTPKTVDIKALADSLQKEITYTDTLAPMEDDLFSYLYTDIAAEDIKDKVIYLSSGSTAEEIAVFEAVDEAAAERIKTGLDSRIAMQKEGFEDYVPEEVKRIDDAVLKTSGKYVVLSISGDSSKAEELINSAF